jgi:hypothetical protein
MFDDDDDGSENGGRSDPTLHYRGNESTKDDISASISDQYINCNAFIHIARAK